MGPLCICPLIISTVGVAAIVGLRLAQEEEQQHAWPIPMPVFKFYFILFTLVSSSFRLQPWQKPSCYKILS